jgi:hypothetical protein
MSQAQSCYVNRFKLVNIFVRLFTSPSGTNRLWRGPNPDITASNIPGQRLLVYNSADQNRFSTLNLETVSFDFATIYIFAEKGCHVCFHSLTPRTRYQYLCPPSDWVASRSQVTLSSSAASPRAEVQTPSEGDHEMLLVLYTNRKD